MLNYLKSYVKDKSVLILGFGREGRSTYNTLKKAGTYKSLAISDGNKIDFPFENGEALIFGDNYQDILNDYDIVFKSPGIVLKHSVEYYTCDITSQTEVFISCYRNNIIGISGTKGKSTISTLLYHILKESGINCRLVGNIGIPSFDMLDEISKDMVFVYELSCHQLEYTNVSAHITIFTNLFEEHLDHYGTFEKYKAAKKNLFIYQTEQDYAVCCLENTDFVSSKAKKITVSAHNKNADYFVDDKKISFENTCFSIGENSLLGKHNELNITMVYAVCKLFGISDLDFNNSLLSYTPLHHRLEYIGTKDGVRYYDDSISTICAAAISAVESVPNAQTILIGGMDRGIDYTDLVEFFMSGKIKNIICMYESGKRVYDEITDKKTTVNVNLCLVSDLKEAVQKSKEITEKGKACILSPAAASYGYFKNFEERGDMFKKLIFDI